MNSIMVALLYFVIAFKKAALKCFNTLDSTTLERVILGKKYYHSFLLQRGRMIVLPTAK